MTEGSPRRFVLCDDEEEYARFIERIILELGHELVGVTATAADAVALIEAARPDVVIFDLSTDFNSDFDVVAAAATVGATVVVFSQRADEMLLSRYEIHPTVVHKPDLIALEQVLRERGSAGDEPTPDRRHRPARVPAGPVPTGLEDSQAFYEALNEAAEGDALVSIDLVDHGSRGASADLADRLRTVIRAEDRLLSSPSSVRVFLPAGGTDAIASFVARASDTTVLPDGATIRTVVLVDGESPMDAFDRLRSTASSPLPPDPA